VLDPIPLDRLKGNEPLTPEGGHVLEFWQWAFSDLRSNVVRGVLAEYLVARALNADLSRPRVSWDNYDFITAEGWRSRSRHLRTCRVGGNDRRRPSPSHGFEDGMG